MLLSSSFILSVSACMILIQGAYCDEYEDYADTDNNIAPDECDGTTDTPADDCNNDLPDDYDPPDEDEPTHPATPRKRARHRRVKIVKVPVLAHRRIVHPRPACSPIIINPTARKPRTHHHTLLSPITNFVYAFVKAFLVGPECD